MRTFACLARRCFILSFLCAPVAAADIDDRQPTLNWQDNYGSAYAEAQSAKTMLLVYFQDRAASTACRSFEDVTLKEPAVLEACRRYVLVRMPVDASVTVAGQQVQLLRHKGFRHLNGAPGLAVIDFANAESPSLGHTVGCLPFERPAYYAAPYHEPRSVAVFLNLPAGTLTQRMMVYAVRMHPESPQSTAGTPHAILFDECRSHSNHQARIRRQGHHQWETRFHRIWGRLGGKHPTEVCAESWPGKTLLAACLDCVHSWRQSSGHWHAVQGRHAAFGYDIARGSNGIWYATGIFGGPNK